MMHKPVSQKSFIVFVLLIVVFGINTTYSATPAGSKVYPTISNTQAIELIGGSVETVSWRVPAAGTYKLWVEIIPTSTASNATYLIYPKGNAVGNDICSSTDPTYPCYQVIINQATTVSDWAQLMINHNTASSWTFTASGYVSVTANGVSRAEQLGVAQFSFQHVNPVTLNIGQTYQGGKIFYFDGTGQHGLIASPIDQGTRVTWYNGQWLTIGATGADIGTGQANTTAIVQAQGAGSYAAKVCDDLVLGGYNDWYLPSKDELNQLYLHQPGTGGLTNYYWSSTESGSWNAGAQFFSYGTESNYIKSALLAVRCVRSF